MKLIHAYVQPHKLDEVTMALHRIPDLSGVAVHEVQGRGRGHHEDGSSAPSE